MTADGHRNRGARRGATSMRVSPKAMSLGLAVLISVALILPASGQEDDVTDASLDQAVEESVEVADGSVGEAPPPTTPVPTPSVALSERDIAAKVGPSIVQIRVGDFGGSGVKVAQGVLTAAHLVSRGANPEIITGGGQRARATAARCDTVK